MRITEDYIRKMIRRVLLEIEEAQERVFSLESPKVLIHRTWSSDLGIEDLDPSSPRISKQSRGGRLSVVGVYAYSLEDAESPGAEKYGDRKIRIVLPAGTRVLDLTGRGRGSTSRVSERFAKELLSQGIEAIVGYDWIGPPEWVILRMPR